MKRWPRKQNGKATPLYSVWHSMNARCVQAGRSDAEFYRDKGIRVCTRWMQERDDNRGFDHFCEDMAPRPDGYTLSRFWDTEGYGPDNVKWASWQEQASEWYRGDDEIKVDGVSRTKTEWAAVLGISYRSLCKRLQRGWGLEAYRLRNGERRARS